MELLLESDQSKESVFQQIGDYLDELELKVDSIDIERPWGGFFVIAATSTANFIDTFFPEFDMDQIQKYGSELSPKILVVEPNQRLSWQYHYRRAELWRVVAGPVGIVTSDTDEQGEVTALDPQASIQFDAKARHRLTGLENWGIVAEIWQHTDSQHPADESDIVRVEDDYAR